MCASNGDDRLAAATQTGSDNANVPACRPRSRWLLLVTEDGVAESASPRCCLSTLVVPDGGARVAGKEKAACASNRMLQSPAACFLKSNRWTSAGGETRNSLHLSGPMKTLYACAATRDLTSIVGLSPSCSFPSELSSGIRKL